MSSWHCGKSRLVSVRVRVRVRARVRVRVRVRCCLVFSTVSVWRPARFCVWPVSARMRVTMTRGERVAI